MKTRESSVRASSTRRRNSSTTVAGDRSSEVFSGSEKRFQALALAVLENQQIERDRLARLLHDEVAPVLSGAGLQLDILRMDLEDKVPEISSRTAEIQGLLERVVKHIRDLSYEFNPNIAKRSGLQPALNLLVRRFRRMFPGTLRLAYDHAIRIPVEAQTALSRVAEEAVANAVRHAQCTEIEVVVEATGDGAALRVRDNGTGFDDEAERRAPRGLGLFGLGLLMMEYRACKAGLRWNVNGRTGAGSEVSAIFVDPKAAPASSAERQNRGANAV